MPHDEQQILNADHALATLANTLGNNPSNPSDSYCFPPIDDDRAMVSHVRRELKRELKEAISLSLSLSLSISISISQSLIFFLLIFAELVYIHLNNKEYI